MDRVLAMAKIAEIGKLYNLIESCYITPETKFDFEIRSSENYGKLADGRWCYIDSYRIEVFYISKEVSQEAIYMVTKLAEIYSYLHSKEYGNTVTEKPIFNCK
jgi:hypothetical protein